MVKDSFGNCAPYSKPIHMSYDADNDFIARVINTIIQYQEEENECCIVIPRNDILNVDFNPIEEKFFTVDFEKLEGVNTGTLNDLLNDITLLSKKFDFIFITVEKQNGVSLFIDGESKYNCTLNNVKLILIEEKILFNKPNPKFNSVDEDEYYPDVYSLEDLKLYELLNLLDKYKSKDKVLYWRIRHEITRRKSKNNKKKKKKKFELRKGDFDD